MTKGPSLTDGELDSRVVHQDRRVLVVLYMVWCDGVMISMLDL